MNYILNNMEVYILLNSILTVSSILVAVGFPFTFFVVNDYKNKKEILVAQIKTYYPKLNSFRKLINLVYKSGVIKDYDSEIIRAENNLEKKEVEKNEAYPFFKAFKYISKKYDDELTNKYNINKLISYEEVLKYQIYANTIWYDIDCRTDIIKELNNDPFENLESYEKNRITEAIAEIDSKYQKNRLTIGVIALIAGDFEVEIANDLAKKTWEYEKPIPKVVKHLFIILTTAVLFGVILPLILLQFPAIQFCLLIMAMSISIILCFICIIWITGKYIWSKMD